jgi:hypothetical protein
VETIMIISLLASGLLSWSAFGMPAADGGAFQLQPLQEPVGYEEFRQGWDDRRYAPPVRARLLVDGERDLYRSGDRLRVRFSTSEDAHVALIHIDPDGRLEFLFPYTPWESDWVRGGRSYSLPRSYSTGLQVHGRPGIGYLYLIASPVPLDYRHFSRGRGGPWDWSYAGRMVTGDPFWAMEQITRLLVPGYAPHASDYYSYYVGARHRYPGYACSDSFRGTRGGWGWSSGYGSCSRLDLFLRQHPYYYDTRLYRGDRRGYLTRTYGSPPEQHRFKEPALGANPRAQEQPRRAPEQPRRDAERATTPADRPQARPPAAGQPERTTERRGEAAQPSRPTLERRTPERQGTTRQAAPEPRSERREPQRESPGTARGSSGSQSRGASPAPAARGTDRRNDAPAARPAPSRESSSSGAARNRRPPKDES